MAHHIVALIPDHQTYVEPFGGSGAVLLNKTKSEIEHFNDLDHILISFWRVIQSERLCKKLIIMLENTLYSRAEWSEALKEYKKRLTAEGRKQYHELLPGDIRDIVTPQDEEELLNRAWACFVATVQGMGSFVASDTHGGWSYGKTQIPTARTFRSKLIHFPELQERMKHVQVDCRDALDVIRLMDGDRTFFYLDPPYVASSREETTREVYAVEGDDDFHEKLLDLILNIQGKVLLSGYHNPLYDKKLKDWTTEEKEIRSVATHDAMEGGKGLRTEVLWRNYNVQKRLF